MTDEHIKESNERPTGLYVRYHPKVNLITIDNEEGYDPWGHSPSFCLWIVPGTVDPMDD